MPPKPKRPFPMPNRSGALRAEVDSSAIWAVSYSDLLMVLLAFFILYFRFGENNAQTLLQKLSVDVGQKLGTGTAAAASAQNAPGATGIRELGRTLSVQGLKVTQSGEPSTLTVEFPDDFFPPGRFRLSNASRDLLRQVFERIAPQRDHLAFVFIGHTDEIALRAKAHDLIDSNLALSNMRALEAAKFAIASGMDPRDVATQGTGEYQRRARSLSLRISERGTP